MISSIYKNEKILSVLKKEFKEKNLLKLESVFPLEEYKKIKNQLEKLHLENKKIPDKFSYSESNLSQTHLDPELINLIDNLTNLKIKNLSVKKFKHKDYTLIHDSQNSKETKFFLFLSGEWDPDHGGNFVFTKSDNQTFYVTPTPNSLFAIKKSKDLKEFVQYVNHLANEKSVLFVEGILR